MPSVRACLLVVALLVGPAHADDAGSASPPKITRQRRIAAVAAAIMPGIVVRGSGSYLVHERRSARRLATIAAIGLGGMLVGGAPLLYTAANPYSVIGFPVLIAGAGLFGTTWFSDIAIAAGMKQPGTALARRRGRSSSARRGSTIHFASAAS